MSGSKSGNSEAVDFQKQQAQKAEQKEAQRQARLDTGKTLIDQIFSGAPVLKDVVKNFDWSTFKPPSAANPFTGAGASAGTVPAGFTAMQVADPNFKAPSVGARGGQVYGQFGSPNSKDGYMNQHQYVGGDSGKDAPRMGSSSMSAGRSVTAPKIWALKGPDGKIYYQGQGFGYNTKEDTGQRTGGFNDDFYKGYTDEYLDLYQPEEQRQYDIANRDLGYNLARSGLRRSSVAADKQGELAYNDALQKAKIVSDASTATGDLRKQVDAQKQQVLNQLYSTEDPSLAQSLASSSAKGLQLQNPTMTPGTAFFDPLLSAVGSGIANYTSPYNRSTGSGPRVAGAGSTSGKGYS